METSTVKPSKTTSSATTNTTITVPTTQNENSHNWTDLPSDILLHLIKYLNLKIDIPRLRGVCPAWRSAIPLSIIPEISSKFKIPGIFNEKPLFLLATRFYLFSPLNPSLDGQWVARMMEIGPNKWHLFNPFQLHEYVDYFMPFPPVTGEINLLTCRVTELCTSWVILPESRSGSRPNALDPVSKKVVGGWNFKSDYLFAVLAQLTTPGRGSEGGLVFWRQGSKECTKFEETFAHTWRIIDIAYLDGKFYAFDVASWRMGVIDVDYYEEDEAPEMEFFSVPDIKGEDINDHFSLDIDGCKYMLGNVFLVPSNGRLVMVVVGNPNLSSEKADEKAEKKLTMFFFVLKAGREPEGNTWERVPDMGDTVFLIGYDTSFSIPSVSKNLPKWKPSSICLVTWPFPVIFDYSEPKGLKNVHFPKYWSYMKMYHHNTEHQEEKGIVPIEKLGKEKYTGLFFPPPAWVVWRRAARGKAVVILHNLKFSTWDL